MSADPNRAQTNTQNTPVQVYTPVIQLNPPRSTTNIVKPSDIVSLISIPEVENIYQRTLSWIQEVPPGSYCELPHSQCSVYKNEDGRIYIQIPPINGLPQTLPVSDFFEKWKLLIATATRHMQNNPSQSGPSQPTQTPQSNPTIVMPQLPQTNLPQVSTHVDSRPRGVGSSSQSQPQPPRPPPLHNQQPPQPRSSQPHPQRLPQHHPPQLPQTQRPQHYKAQPPGPQPRPQTQSQVQPPNLQQPVLGTQTQLLQKAIVQAQSQINSRPQNYTAQPEPQPSASAQESNAIAPEGFRNSPDIVQITLPKRRAPGDADKKRLAKDLLFALGKRVRPDAPADRPSEGSSKKHVSEQMVQSSSSLASALDYNIAYNAAQASTRSAVSSGPNVAPTSGSSFHTFSIAGPISGSVSYVQASTASSAIPMSTKAPQHLYPIINTVNTAPPAPPVTQATTSEVAGTPNPKPSTPTAPVNTGASSGAAAASSIEIASVPPSPSTDLGQNPYRVLLTTTTNTIPRASVPIVPQRSSHESSTPVAQPTTAPLTASKDGATAAGPSVTSPATLPIALSSASISQVSGEQQEEPLFLPGTPEQDESDIEVIEQPTKVVKKPVGQKVVNRAYVLIPKPSAKIRRLMQRKSAPSDVRSSHRNFMVVSETESEEGV
ncbi:hypothetical protein BJ165DRAFT_83556 [Panaeolus papilionaceus]|nr:hypothetical protein BJ165DRAFT_83556 [Panaeolus papilionaceus]